MKKIYRIIIVFACIFLSPLLIFDNVWTQPNVAITVIPNIQTITVGSGPERIAIIAQVRGDKQGDKQNLKYKWSCDCSEGKGELKGKDTGPGILYSPPDKIDGQSAQDTVTLIVTDRGKEIANKEVIFTLMVPPSPTPTPTPIPPRIVEVSLEDAQGVKAPLTYKFKPGSKITITTDVIKPSNNETTVVYEAISGEIIHDQQKITYIVPNMPGSADLLTIRVVDNKTNETVDEKLITISIGNQL